MTPVRGESVQLAVEKPAAGGRMIARLNGQIVLVGGAIPGERVTARVERVGKGVVYAETVGVTDPSPDRRTVVAADPLCGGCLYAHIDYPRQLDIKAQVVTDAFGRIGRLALPSAVHVIPSAEEGYRMRARLHVRGRRAGFFREGTHELCDARQSRQLLPSTCDVIDAIGAALVSLDLDTSGDIDLSENVDASNRVVCVDAGMKMNARVRERLVAIDGLTGVGPDASVTDVIAVEGAAVPLSRNVRSFFQGNRYLLNALTAHVVGLVPSGGDLLDLYAGSGLFSVTAAAVRGVRVTAVEGDGIACGDLRANASAHPAVTVHHLPVEDFLERRRDQPGVAIVDPPRTGLSRAALDGLVRLRAGRVVYVSCDVATLARDARGLVNAGYTIERADAFDLFPNTPHVETVAVFEAGPTSAPPRR
jgi:23S rRNA (uracil1939-C5)-methyltransferase